MHYLISTHTSPASWVGVRILILQIRFLRLREVKTLAQSHTVSSTEISNIEVIGASVPAPKHAPFTGLCCLLMQLAQAELCSLYKTTRSKCQVIMQRAAALHVCVCVHVCVHVPLAKGHTLSPHTDLPKAHVQIPPIEKLISALAGQALKKCRK